MPSPPRRRGPIPTGALGAAVSAPGSLRAAKSSGPLSPGGAITASAMTKVTATNHERSVQFGQVHGIGHSVHAPQKRASSTTSASRCSARRKSWKGGCPGRVRTWSGHRARPQNRRRSHRTLAAMPAVHQRSSQLRRSSPPEVTTRPGPSRNSVARTAWKASAVTRNPLTGVRARTVALRGDRRTRAVSPKWPPRCRTPTLWMPRIPSASCNQAIFVNETTHRVGAHDPPSGRCRSDVSRC